MSAAIMKVPVHMPISMADAHILSSIRHAPAISGSYFSILVFVFRNLFAISAYRASLVANATLSSNPELSSCSLPW